MTSLIWGGIFVLLIAELILTLVLAIPVPRKLRNALSKEIFQLHLGDRLARPILYLGIALALALIESYLTRSRIVARMADEHEASLAHETMYHVHDKERKYKAERNLYLAGFSLTLLFVIGRITTLMQESVELEEETERVKSLVSQKKSGTVSDKKSD